MTQNQQDRISEGEENKKKKNKSVEEGREELEEETDRRGS
jgi:hypothetical protein